MKYTVIVWKNIDERIIEFPCETYERGVVVQQAMHNLVKTGYFGECDKVGLHEIETGINQIKRIFRKYNKHLTRVATH